MTIATDNEYPRATSEYIFTINICDLFARKYDEQSKEDTPSFGFILCLLMPNYVYIHAITHNPSVQYITILNH